MILAAIQMVSGADVPTNLRAAQRLLEQAAEGGARLAVLPENFAAMGHGDPLSLALLEAHGQGPVLPWLARTARDLGFRSSPAPCPCRRMARRWPGPGPAPC